MLFFCKKNSSKYAGINNLDHENSFSSGCYTVVHLKFGSDVSAFLWCVLSARLPSSAQFINAIKEMRIDVTTKLEVNHGIGGALPWQWKPSDFFSLILFILT